MAVTEQGSALIRWNRSRCSPRASATIALMTSPWLHASHTASGPDSASTRALWSRIAATARAWVSRSGSPSGPGKTAALGMRLDDLPQRVLGERLEVLPRPVAVAALAETVVDLERRVSRPARIASVGLQAAIERAADGGGERQGPQPLGDGLRLLPPPLVEPEARASSRRAWGRSCRSGRAGRGRRWARVQCPAVRSAGQTRLVAVSPSRRCRRRCGRARTP